MRTIAMRSPYTPKPQSLSTALAINVGLALVANIPAISAYGGDNRQAAAIKSEYNRELAFVQGTPLGQWTTDGKNFDAFTDDGAKTVRVTDPSSSAIHVLEPDGTITIFEQKLGFWDTQFTDTRYRPHPTDNVAVEKWQDTYTRYELMPPLSRQTVTITRVMINGGTAHRSEVVSEPKES